MNYEQIDWSAATDAGPAQEENLDQFLVADLVKGARILDTSLGYDPNEEIAGTPLSKVFLVADGGDSGSTSRVAVQEMLDFMVMRMRWFAFSRDANVGSNVEGLNTDLVVAMTSCLEKIQGMAADRGTPSEKRLGLTVSVIDESHLHVVHVGHSRCYVLRGSAFDRATIDHSVSQGSARSPSGGLWNVRGTGGADFEPEVRTLDLQVGDKILWCTDGLTQRVSDQQIARILSEANTADEACESLMEFAKATGGQDSMTVMVAVIKPDIVHLPGIAQEAATQRVVIVDESDPSPAGVNVGAS